MQSVHIPANVVSSNPTHARVLDTTYCDKFVRDLQQVGGFLRFPNKTDRHDIAEMLLKVALNTINIT
jgi:hypothetical protein